MAAAVARSAAEPSHRDAAYAAIVEAQLQIGDFAGAQKTAALIRARPDEARRYIAKAQANAGDFAAALSTAQGIKSSVDKGSSLRDIAEVQARTGRVDAAFRTVGDIGGDIGYDFHRLGGYQAVAKQLAAKQQLAPLWKSVRLLPSAAEHCQACIGAAEGLASAASKRKEP